MIESRRLCRKIPDQISCHSQSGKFAPGLRLPAERELARQLGVSRPSARETLIVLELTEFVEVRMGSRIFVCYAEAKPRPIYKQSENRFATRKRYAQTVREGT